MALRAGRLPDKDWRPGEICLTRHVGGHGARAGKGMTNVFQKVQDKLD
jgi:hypothetical protein